MSHLPVLPVVPSLKGSRSIDETAVPVVYIRDREIDVHACVCVCVLLICGAVLLIHRPCDCSLPQLCLVGFTGQAEAATLQHVTGGCVCVCVRTVGDGV